MVRGERHDVDRVPGLGVGRAAVGPPARRGGAAGGTGAAPAAGGRTGPRWGRRAGRGGAVDAGARRSGAAAQTTAAAQRRTLGRMTGQVRQAGAGAGRALRWAGAASPR
ncbi:hypothetical protein ACQEVS_33055 [Streptomyces sp. CA-181903]|uniref:hypothetical protein n=1 Tax=Streptomyces sp. CA-181903 TaxID=3240055 RepID=UPI003D9228A9